jgi:hypothetical protein
VTEQLSMESIAQPGLRPGRHLTLQERFDEWIESREGRHAYEEVVAMAYRLRAAGHARYSMKALWEVIRTDRQTPSSARSVFKLNNDYTSRMARRVMADYPDLAGFFETRTVKA